MLQLFNLSNDCFLMPLIGFVVTMATSHVSINYRVGPLDGAHPDFLLLKKVTSLETFHVHTSGVI